MCVICACTQYVFLSTYVHKCMKTYILVINFVSPKVKP